VAAGIRRIEALTGEGARAHAVEAEAALDKTAAFLKIEPPKLPGKVRALLDTRRRLQRELADARRRMATGAGGGGRDGETGPKAEPDGEAVGGDSDDILGQTAALLKVQSAEVPGRVEALVNECEKMQAELAGINERIASGGGAAQEIKQVAGIRYQPRLLDAMPAKELKSLADELKKQVGSGVVALVSINDGKASVVVGVTDDLTERLSAVDLVRAGSEAVGGKGGGGRADMAQAGGPDGANAQAALDAIENAIAATG
jgi:alanyl-tRNA synthetase